MSAQRGPAKGISPGTLVVLWVILIGLAAGAYYGLPVYMESLDQRIVFRSPNCMDVAQEQARATMLELSERGDSLQTWMTRCLEERQEEMARHADLVGYGTMGALIAMSIVLTALIIQTALSRAQRTAHSIARWASKWQMQLAGEKTQTLVLSQWWRDVTTAAGSRLFADGKRVTFGDTLKLLGVKLDHRRLHFGPHCKSLKQRVRP